MRLSPFLPFLGVTRDGKTRSAHVALVGIGQDSAALGQRSRAPRLASLPHAQEPHPVETLGRQAVQLAVRHVAERGRTAEFVQKQARMDLFERRMPEVSHIEGTKQLKR
jgi:hypothetical protein